ncbi:MAG: 2Fe-2S iron-sulfur cluster binding domain-containing protein, partial [Magnetococcales bacterium]|nr:2Fe-2S iron-sulfur cluster binding domain-containing protein [Magnetococcales bacterium]
ITFSHSEKELTWNAETGSLLELAEQNQVAMESGCRAGSCGACEVAIKSGTISNIRDPGKAEESQSCLACVSIPSSDLVLDA